MEKEASSNVPKMPEIKAEENAGRKTVGNQSLDTSYFSDV